MIPAAAVYWIIGVLIRTPIFSVGLGLASIVPSVLMLNTKVWYCYPMDYPFYMLMTEYGKLVPELFSAKIELVPMVPIGIGTTLLCLTVACGRYGAAERNSGSL